MANFKPIPIHAAKAQLSKLIARALKGEEVIICKGSTPVIRLQPISASSGRKFGAYKGKGVLKKSFFDPLPEDELDAWEK